MQNKHAVEKLDKIANVIIFVQIIMTIFNVIFGFWSSSQFYLYGLLLSGIFIRAAIQIWLIKKEKNSPKNSTAWWMLIYCLASGFTNIFSSYGSFHWGNLELLLIVCGIILLFRHYSHIKSIRIEHEEKKMEEQEK